MTTKRNGNPQFTHILNALGMEMDAIRDRTTPPARQLRQQRRQPSSSANGSANLDDGGFGGSSWRQIIVLVGFVHPIGGGGAMIAV